MSIRTLSLTVATATPQWRLVDGSFRPRPASSVVFASRETLAVVLQCYTARGVADAFEATDTFTLALKDLDDLSGDALVLATTVTSGAAELAAGQVTFNPVNLNTVELIAWLSTGDSKVARLEVIQQDADGNEERILVRQDVVVVHDSITGDEGSPSYATALIHNTSATAAPTSGDDTADGYAPGSRWVWPAATGNGGNARVWECLDATEGTAVWEELTAVELAFALEAPGNATIPLLGYAQGNFVVAALAIKTASGTVTASLQVDGVDVTGLADVAVSSTVATATATAANLLAAGSALTLVLESSSAATWVQGTVLLRRGE